MNVVMFLLVRLWTLNMDVGVQKLMPEGLVPYDCGLPPHSRDIS